MKMKLLRRPLAFLCLLSMLVMTGACGKASGDEPDKQSYTANNFEIPKEITDVSRLLINNETAYVCCTESDENNETVSFIASMSLDNGNFQKLPLEIDNTVNLLDFGIDQDNNIWAVCKDSSETYTLRKFNNSGTALQSAQLSGILDSKAAAAPDNELFLSIDANGNIGVAIKDASTYMYVFDKQEHFLFDLYYDGNLLTTITTAEGKIGVCSAATDRMNYNLLTVDVDNEAWDDDEINLGTTTGLYGGITNSFYLFDSTDLYGYNAETGNRQVILNWSDTGLNTTDVHICELPDGRFVVLSASSSQTSAFSYDLDILEQGSDDRTVLSMVSLSASPSISQAVSDFNKTNEDYKIELTEYFPYEQNVSDEDWDNAIQKLNTEIISGKIPDIIDMSDLPVEVYYSKGMLEDLYPYLENDPEINIEDYYENVFEATSIDGELPFITNGVTIWTMIADSSKVGDDPGWTYDDLEALLERYGSDSLGGLTGEGLLQIMLQTSDRFVDWSTGECYFDTSDFIELLKLAGKLSDSEKNAYRGTPDSSHATVFEAVMTAYQIARYHSVYDGNLNLIGLPNDSGAVYYAIKPSAKIGISSACHYKEGAWSFVRSFLDEKQQESCYTLPIRKESFNNVMQAAIKGDSIWTTLYENVKVTQKDVDITEALLNSASYAASNNQALEDIVLDEASSYFAGDKTAEEVAANIQNRAMICVNEQK